MLVVTRADSSGCVVVLFVVPKADGITRVDFLTLRNVQRALPKLVGLVRVAAVGANRVEVGEDSVVDLAAVLVDRHVEQRRQPGAALPVRSLIGNGEGLRFEGLMGINK